MLEDGDGARFRREFLFVDAVVRHRVACLALCCGALRHIIMFGGNNVGKSTVVNILAASSIADTSPEGGHTVYPQAFVAGELPLFGQNRYAFQEFVEAPPVASAGPQFAGFTRSRISSEALPQDVAIWDTPDCDAVGSSRYLAGVVEAVAAADVVVYVTSAEHYAVEHLLEWLFLLHDAGLPIVECINKTRERDRRLIIDGQIKRIFPLVADRLGLPAPTPTIVPLRYLSEGQESDLWGAAHPEATQLREAVLSAVRQSDRAASGRTALSFAVRRIGRLLEPVRLELAARRVWTEEVRESANGFVAAYERLYLTSDSVIEPFSRLNLAILELLDPDIPGLKQAMATIRSITRWPSRMILRMGRQLYRTLFPAGGAALDGSIPAELKAYSEAHVELLSALGRRIDREREAPRHHPFWDNMAAEWDDQLKQLSAAFSTSIQSQMRRSDEEIKRAAADIYATLAKRPTTLHLLRGARVAANVGGALVGIMLPHHGIVFDLLEEAIIAPAMMSATEAA
ncbi:MAG: 50S ribosome-binding GTPase, partial [Acidobacteria bacterium]|nr:50S ribosome-binding GTPase [Acidobacteriota bacterium]